jgi:hypothetical protein
MPVVGPVPDLDGEQRLRDLDALQGDDLPDEEENEGDFEFGECSDSEEELEPTWRRRRIGDSTASA